VLSTVLFFRAGVRHGVIKMPSICIRIVKFLLARHSDIRLTMNVYTHTELAESQAQPASVVATGAS